MGEDAELTTQQAADFLNVSRAYLIELLDQEGIAYRTVGAEHWIKVEPLRRYLEADSQRRRAAADELTALGEELTLE